MSFVNANVPLEKLIKKLQKLSDTAPGRCTVTDATIRVKSDDWSSKINM